MAISKASLLESLANHVALPPRLPGKRESQLDQIENALTDRLLDASRTIRDLTHGEISQQWDGIRRILQTCRTINAGGKLDKKQLLTEFRGLGSKHVLIVHVAEQNAGLLIRRQNSWVYHHFRVGYQTDLANMCSVSSVRGEIVIFEAFEASPVSDKVLAAENALQWDFPGCTVDVPYVDFNNTSFQENLAEFLEQASIESIKRFAAHTNKAGSLAFESRDTVDPSLITQMLMTLLEVIGDRVFPPQLRKRVHDEVCVTDGAAVPWRRSPYWLVVRVSLQRHLCTLNGTEAGRAYYKFLTGLVLARLVEDALDHLSPEVLAFLNAKLARRLVKLEAEKDAAVSNIRAVYQKLFTTLGSLFYKTIKKVRERIEVMWNDFKQVIRRPIQPLPRVADQKHLILSLPNSGSYLQQVLSEWRLFNNNGPRSFATHRRKIEFDISAVNAIGFRTFADLYLSIQKIEIEIDKAHIAGSASIDDLDARCINHAKQIGVYLTAVAKAYDSCPEQKSIMLLKVMEMWMLMDQCAVELFNLLLQYNPGIPPDILDVLQLSSFEDMCRLQKTQNYLRDRYIKCGLSRRTIFDNPTEGCFAERYFEDSNDSEPLRRMHQGIEVAAESARREKEDEWRELSAEFEELQRSIAEGTCLYITEDIGVIHDDRRCTKCYLERKARRMKILLHEHPLPTNPVEAKAVVFELGCPKAFAAYRNATWKVLGTISYSKPMESFEPKVILCDYLALKDFLPLSKPGVSLASTAKSFLSTHFKGISFPNSLEQVCVPNGLKLKYFDSLTTTWPGREAQIPTFAHHCPIIIPPSSPFSSLKLSPEFSADSNGPSSYQVIASQTKCPSGLNIHEFMTYQALFSGKFRRWPAILVELGSSNVNFSTEAVTILITQLALQAGPACGLDPLRAVHGVFRHESFCRRLMEQVGLRLDAISSNWRESNCMEMLLTLILRLCVLASEPIIGEAIKLLEAARQVIFSWIKQLRIEVYNSTDASESERYSRYAFLAALLCRRTFTIHAEDVNAGNVESLQPAALHCFIACSITLQDNSTGNPAALPPLVRNALIRDLKMAYRMRFVLRQSLEAHPESLESAIDNVWPQPENDVSRSYAEYNFLESPNEWWIHSTVHAGRYTKQQTIHYHLLEGHLFVDSQPLGKLPAKHRQSVVLKELFGDQMLQTFPSGLRGMTYMLAYNIEGHQVHFGFRDKNLITHACIGEKILEFIPQNVFGDVSTSSDLPASLVHNCVHWLDLHSGVIEIRKRPDIWISKPRNWRLDFNTRSARRVRSSLVDPHSALFHRIARIFDRFENRGRLTVYQPATGKLSVELRRLELSFFVNSKNLLECRELRSEIDPDQDAKTWYGLVSKLVLRDTNNPRQRSIIVPIGAVGYVRNQFHVAVNVENDGSYARFFINDVLGRLDCPAEPILLYLKAHLHACTSFVLPDRLTGRTGTEEAFHCLKSGYSLPWTPLNRGPLECLMSIAKLAPRREYYPQDMKTVQDVFWDPNLTTTIQHDEFRPTIEAIREKINQLAVFALKRSEIPSFELASCSTHLLNRSCSRRNSYLRSDADLSKWQVTPDLPYKARDRCENSQARLNVFESANLIRNWPSKIHVASNLVEILQNWPTIGGYDRFFDKVLLSDRLDIRFALEWGSLANLCRTSERKDAYRFMFLFAIISFRNDAEMDIIRILIAFVVFKDLKELDPPQWPCYLHFRYNHIPTADYLKQLIKNCRVPYPGDERTAFHHNLGSKLRRKLEAAELAHDQQTESDCDNLARFLLSQWPCSEPTVEGFPNALFVDVAQSLEIIRPEWLRLFQNIELSHHIQQVQHVLNRHQTTRNTKFPIPPHENHEFFPMNKYYGGEPLTLARKLSSKSSSEFDRRHPIVLKENARLGATEIHEPLFALQKGNFSKNLQPHTHTKGKVSSTISEIPELERIIEGITDSHSIVKQRYGRDMMQSLNALKTLESAPKHEKKTINRIKLFTEISVAQNAARELFDQICVVIEGEEPCYHWLKEGGLWPCITPVTLLEQLRSTSTSILGDGMKENLVAYGVCITRLQRLLRIEDAYLRRNDQKLLEEQSTLGHGNWQPLSYPDWLLFEIDANILIRHDQVDVALATISPDSRSNSVLQMNMGQGKTSTIMPMVAAVLADMTNLLRVVVPKPLLLQTAQVLQGRLGGLIGREVWHIPFSRKTPTDSKTIGTFYNIHKRAKASSAIIVALPDHILSFMLSGLQRLSDKRIFEATNMVQVQAWMRKKCRDVLDECDFTLAVRTQLIYPSGSQAIVDGHPHRWETAEALLRSVESHLWNLQQEFPQSIEVVRRLRGGFPIVFFLRTDVEDALIARLVKDIFRGQISTVPIQECSQADRLAIKHFILDANVGPVTIERIRQVFSDKPAMKKNIYLIRGLLVHRILLLTLKKRWNVQYGLHPFRDPIAVPFHAKGVPSEQAEWGHPDVAILLTCLAFYFGGLDLAQLRQSLEHVLKSDDPSSEYDRWTQSSRSLPDSLREWNIINVDDATQLVEIWQHVRYEVIVINYFLNNFVFPKHAKQFQMKLQASGWDVPLFSPKDQLKPRQEGVRQKSKPLTTGFSGTNDNRTMLPLTIRQDDLQGLLHTNAEVLTYLLQPRNRGYALAADNLRKHFSEISLLHMLHHMKIRMLIDAGAQILEMDNLSLVKEWMKVDHEASAAVYFNNDNKPFVYYRHGSQTPLLASPFAENLDNCLVYLDEAHTRGTDLKMPSNATGALTLGLGQTKDHTVQAAMRLRQLATSQAIVFFAPPEVDQSIRDLRKKKIGDPLDSHDVICWLLEQTCSSIEQIQPLFYSHGANFCLRTQAALDNPDFLDNTEQLEAYLSVLRQSERQTLEQLYMPRPKSKPMSKPESFFPEIAEFMKELNTRRKGFQDTGNAVHGSTLQEVEQEREVAFEVEATREIQKPTHYSPLSFSRIHKEIVKFVKTGILAVGYGGYEQAFVALRQTSLGTKYGISSEATSSRLFVSKEFARTVSLPSDRPNDNFLRQVNWILWSVKTETALIIIPEEVEILLPLLRDVENPPTYILTYAAPVTRKMLNFNTLQYFSIPTLPTGWKPPAWLVIELGIFAGRLYFEFDEYNGLRKFLGYQDKDAAPSIEVQEIHDTTDEAEMVTDTPQTQSFTAKPLTFLLEWLTVKRKGQNFSHTPMGYVAQGKFLTKSHPFFSRVDNDIAPKLQIVNKNNDREKSSLDDQNNAASDGINDDDEYFGDEQDENNEYNEFEYEIHYESDDVDEKFPESI